MRTHLIAVLCCAFASPVLGQLGGQSGVKSDDFNVVELDPAWSFVDPRDDVVIGLEGFGTQDARLRFEIPAGPSHDLWLNANYAPRLLQESANTDLLLEAKFDSVQGLRYQMHGILVQESFNHLLRFEIYHDGTYTHVFAARILADTSVQDLVNFTTPVAPDRIRVRRDGDDWTMWTSSDGVTFTEAVSFTYPLTVTQVGVHAGNHWAGAPNTSPAYVALVDYFVNLRSPLAVEDGPVDTEPPVADAGESRAVHPGDTVTLDASGSADDWTAPEDLLYEWVLLDRPAGSTAELVGAATATPTLQIDALGDYLVQLTVVDEVGLVSEPATILLSSLNQAPVANAGADAVIAVENTVVLDGLGSSDADEDPLVYSWSLLMAPCGSGAVLVGADTATPSLTPDVSGEYTVELIVSDGYSESLADSVTVTAVDPMVTALALLREASAHLREQPDNQYLRRFLRKITLLQLRLIAHDLHRGRPDMASCRTEFLLKRTDGCVVRGAPDSWWNTALDLDWIVACELQAYLHDKLTEVLALIE